MSVTKRIKGNYTIINRDPTLGTSSNVTISTNTLYIDGNLIVGGNAQQVTRTDTAITDNIIYLNSGDAGPGVTLNTAGLEINRGSLANVGLLWNESVKAWQVSDQTGGNFSNVATSVGGGTAITALFQDSAPKLSANINLNSHTIYDSTTGNVSANISNVGAGGTGVYSNTYLGNHELISKRMALIYNNLL